MNGHPIGTLVRVNCLGSRMDGRVCRVISAPHLSFVVGIWKIQRTQIVDLPTDDIPWAYKYDELIPIDDGREKGSWSALANIWQPKGVSA